MLQARKWQEPEDLEPPADLLAAVNGSRLAAQALLRRGISTARAAQRFLDPLAYSPSPPEELPGLEAAVERIEQALQHKEPILVWGDFDVDGQTSTALLVGVLRQLGGQVSWYIPVRARESHGVHVDSLARALDQSARLVLTCDTGSAAHAAVDYAKSRGVEVIITDHHELPPTLPDAAALVSPRLLPPGHSLAALPGVGVAYKLAEALCRRAGREDLAAEQLDLTALGIVADVALLEGDTRWLLQQGLPALRSTRRAGFKAIYELAGLQPEGLNETHLGFVLAPRLNALGRLDDANPAVELLTTPDLSRARVLAVQLESLNARRKLLTGQVFEGALAQLQRDPALLDHAALVLAHPGWPAGVIGIVASRLVERYQRPVVLLAAPEGEPARGSARSVEGCHITEAITAQADLLLGFGGHPMAAGMSLPAENIPEFRRRLGRSVAAQLAGRDPRGLAIDAFLSLSRLSLELADELDQLAPFGPGNPPITLAARDLVVKSRTPLGRGGEHHQLIVEDDTGCTQKVVWWGGAGWDLPEGRIDLAFQLHAASYRGSRQVQVEFVDARAGAKQTPLEVRTRPRVVDLRRQPQPLAFLKDLAGGAEVQVWAEAGAVQELESHGLPVRERHNLGAAPGLAVWTSPPGPQELAAALELASPEIVYLFAVPPETARLQGFLQRLAGLVKYALKEKGGRVSMERLAAATAQRQAAVRVGLVWLEQRGVVRVVEMEGSHAQLAPGVAPGEHLMDIQELLESILEESTAFREYYRSAAPEHLL